MYAPSKELAERIAREFGTPVFVSDKATLARQAAKMRSAFGDAAKIFYAIKANYNPHIVKTLKEAGIDGIDAVSPGEIRLALELGFQPEAIAYTPSNPSDEELRYAGEKSILPNLGSLSELARYCALFPDSSVSIRICPEVGAGEFEQVTTGGADSKFGLPLSDLSKAKAVAKDAGVTIVGVHSHIGSGFYEPSAFGKSVEAVCRVAEDLPEARFIDVGGGFGVHYRPDQEEVDIRALAEAAMLPLRDFTARTGRSLELRLEPGKYLVSESTALLARITTVKEKGERLFVGLDTGFNHLIRPAMYGAYHHIVNLSKTDGPLRTASVVGNLCETGDIMNRDIELIDPQEGDLVAILVAGGYGSSMSSAYNMRELAAEVLVEEGTPRLIRRRQTYEDLMAQFT